METEGYKPPEFLREKERYFTEHEDVQVAPNWYYRSREGIFGPFESLEMAEADLAELVFTNPSKREKYVK